MTQTEIIEKVLSYMEEPEGVPRYAIALHGPWGSGKTYFCEHALRDALGKKDCAVLRISLFGVTTIDDFYARALSATSKLEGALAPKLISTAGKGANAAFNVGKAMAEQFLPQIGAFISECGFQMSVKPETILSIIPMEKILVILDDIERSKLRAESTSFYGLINDLTENHNWHIMLVTNKPIAYSDESVEKVVLWQMEYEPAIEELYDSIVKPRLKEFVEFDFDVRAAALRGITGISNQNARSLMKCLGTLRLALSSPALSDSRVSPENRARAFSDFTRYAILTATGDQPKSQDGLPPETKDYLEGYDYKNYSMLEKSLAHLASGKPADPALINQCIDAYIQDRYPESQPDLELVHLYDKCRCLSVLEDNDINTIERSLQKLLEEQAFSGKSIYRAWSIYATLSRLGFCEEMSKDSVIAALTKVIDTDPATAENNLKFSYETWKGTPGIEADPTLDALLAHASKQSVMERQKSAHDLFEGNTASLTTGMTLVEHLNKTLKVDNRPDTVVSGAYVAKAFVAGSAQSQTAMRRFFAEKMPKNKLSYGDHISEIRTWLQDIKDGMTESQHQSKMGAVRAEWLIKDIDDILDTLRE